MKKRIASLLLALPLCLTLLPTTALAEDEATSDRTVIATVEDLQQFARAVDAGDYDGKTDAVVELEEPVYAPYVQRGNFPVLVEKITCKGIRPVPNKTM